MPPWVPPQPPIIIASPTPPRSSATPALVLGGIVSLVAVGAAAAFAMVRQPAASTQDWKHSPPSPSSYVAPVPTPFSPALRFDGSTRPLVLDATGDGTVDYFIRTDGSVFAIDGKSGKQLWTASPKVDRFKAEMTIVGTRLVLNSGVGIVVLDAKTGKETTSATLEDKIRQTCNSTTPKARYLLDGNDVAVVDVESGAVTSEKKGAPCEDASIDTEMAADVERRHFPVSFLPGSLHSLYCGGVNVQGTYNYVFPDPCGPALRMPASELAELEPKAVIPFAGGYVLLGQKRRGKHAPMVGYAKQGKIVWQSTASTDEPAELAEGSPDASGFDGTRVALGCSIGARPHLAVFDALSGARVTTAVLPATATTVTTTGDGRWLVVASDRMLRVSTDGKVETLLGGD